MNGYTLIIWQPVHHNGRFSHNVERQVTVRAEDEREAQQMVPLRSGQETIVHDGLTIRTDDEYIYAIRFLGRVDIKQVYVYEKRGREAWELL